MSTDSNWLVRAAPLDLGTVQGRGEPDLGHWGCLGPIIALILVVIFTLLPDVEFSWFLFLPAGLAVLGLVYLNYRLSLTELDKRYRERIRQKRQSLDRGAEDSAQNALRSLEIGKDISQELERHLADADSALHVAQHEFSSHAFAPFWDAVETAAVALGKYRDGLDKLETRAEWYQQELRDKQHTFPAWGSVVPAAARPDRTLAAFRTIVRQGQTDFEFSNIFEHRRTRQVLIAGFEHLGTALGGLSSAVETKLVQHDERLKNLEGRRS